MFNIYYQMDTDPIEDIVNANSRSITFSLFEGTVSMHDEQNVFAVDFKFPLLDFAYCLLLIDAELDKQKLCRATFAFLDWDDYIYFDRSNEDIEITGTVDANKLKITSNEYRKTVKEFYRKIVFHILQTYPIMGTNAAFDKYLRAVPT
jgi:hypothetical protein